MPSQTGPKSKKRHLIPPWQITGALRCPWGTRGAQGPTSKQPCPAQGLALAVIPLQLEEEEKRDIEFEYLATSAHDYLNRHTDHSFLVTTELQEHFATKNQGNYFSDSGFLPDKNAQRAPYSIKTSKKLDTQTIGKEGGDKVSF